MTGDIKPAEVKQTIKTAKKSSKRKKSVKGNYAFIDSQNLNLGVRSQGWKLDFGRFRVYLKDKYNVEKAFLFIGYLTGNESLYTKLQQSGYIVIFKPTLSIKRGRKVVVKGNVDAELVLHTMIQYDNFDKAVIVSGDGDFRCLVEHLDDNNKLLKLVIPNSKSYSSLLLPYKSYMLLIDKKLGSKIGLKKGRKRK